MPPAKFVRHQTHHYSHRKFLTRSDRDGIAFILIGFLGGLVFFFLLSW